MNNKTRYQFQSDSFFGDIQFVDQGVLRCRFSSKLIENETEYAIETRATNTLPISVERKENEIILSSDHLKVHIDKKDGCLSFIDSSEQCLLADGLPTQFHGEVTGIPHCAQMKNLLD